MKVNSVRAARRCAFTFFANCQFITYSVLNYCLVTAKLGLFFGCNMDACSGWNNDTEAAETTLSP